MALIQTSFYSAALRLNTHLTVIHPGDSANPEPADRIYPVIFLLHGHGGNNQDYLLHSNAARYARNRRAILVCPEVHNSFYLNMDYGRDYYTYLTEEIPQVLRRFFGFEWKRELVSLLGLSMGGYGALHLALARPDLFHAAGSMSGPLDIRSLVQGVHVNESENWRLRELISVLGAETEVKESSDLLVQVTRTVSLENRPRIAVCVGEGDFLFGHTTTFLETCEALVYPLTSWTSPGEHNWEYWDAQLERMMDFCLGIDQES